MQKNVVSIIQIKLRNKYYYFTADVSKSESTKIGSSQPHGANSSMKMLTLYSRLSVPTFGKQLCLIPSSLNTIKNFPMLGYFFHTQIGNAISQ